jgi:predicted ABC-class ATPase
MYLRDLDGKPFGQLRRLSGNHADKDLSLCVEHVQGDPYAPASRFRLDLHPAFHPHLVLPSDPVGRLAMEDLWLREFVARLPAESLPAGDGPGGRLRTASPDESIRRRSGASCAKALSLRFTYSLPAQSRRFLSDPAIEVLLERVPALALEIAQAIKPDRVRELADHIGRRRAAARQVREKGWVAFLPTGSGLHRDADGRPARKSVRLEVPQDLRGSIRMPDGSDVEGLPIRPGVTVVVGSAFHGKTTLLEAVGRASGDLGSSDGLSMAVSPVGTEFVATEEDRSVSTCDLSPFFRRLPGQDPSSFKVDRASGATSQAANVHEALSSGARLLLVDEDASAANFLTRDPRISRLLPEGESVVPLAHRARELASRGISLLVVAGASSEWLAVADQVLVLSGYQPSDATARAREIAPEPPPSTSPAAWDKALADVAMDSWKDLAAVTASKIRVQDGKVRLGASAQAEFPRRFAPDDELRGAAYLLCEWLRHCRDRALKPTRDGLVAFVAAREAAPDPWGGPVGHDLAFPSVRAVWGTWTRLCATRPEPDDSPEL